MAGPRTLLILLCISYVYVYIRYNIIIYLYISRHISICIHLAYYQHDARSLWQLLDRNDDGAVDEAAEASIICYAMLCYAMLCYAMLCYAMLCYAMLYYTILYYTILYYTILSLDRNDDGAVDEAGEKLLPDPGASDCMHPAHYAHIYIYIYIHMCVYIYIYTYRDIHTPTMKHKQYIYIGIFTYYET